MTTGIIRRPRNSALRSPCLRHSRCFIATSRMPTVICVGRKSRMGVGLTIGSRLCMRVLLPRAGPVRGQGLHGLFGTVEQIFGAEHGEDAEAAQGCLGPDGAKARD